MVELAGLPILGGDHSSILAPGPCPSPEGLAQLHRWTIVPILMDLAAAVTQRERKRSLQGTEGVGEGYRNTLKHRKRKRERVSP